MHSPVLGFILVFIAAIAGGGLAVPLKKRRTFELENIYIPSTLVMMVILPLIMAAFVAPQWMEAVRMAVSCPFLAGDSSKVAELQSPVQSADALSAALTNIEAGDGGQYRMSGGSNSNSSPFHALTGSSPR